MLMLLRILVSLAALLGTVLTAAPAAEAEMFSVSYSSDFAQDLSRKYGEREGAYLGEEIINDVRTAFERAGVDAARVEITILEAKPNRPTREQQRRRSGLDASRSMGVGGMALSGVAYDATGELIGAYNYRRFETDIGSVVGFGTWTDAHRVSDRFARRFAMALKR